jgi:hypothetical protein
MTTLITRQTTDSSLYKETYRYVPKDYQSFSLVDEGRKDHKILANKEHSHMISVSWNVTLVGDSS